MNSFRYKLAKILLAIAFVAIAVRLFQFQIIEGFKYSKQVKDYRKQLQPIYLSRGEIVDRNNKVLALDIDKYVLEFNPCESKEDKAALAKKLEKIFGFTRAHLLYGNYSKTLALNLTREQANEIKKINSKHLYLRKIKRRFYPHSNLASHLLGYVDFYSKAREGLELKFEKQLLEAPEESLKLSIDSRLQVFAESQLAERIAQTQADRGCVILMHVATGEILAWAINPNYDPNQYYNYNQRARNNWTLVDVYQPGSVFKIITVSSALDSGAIDKNYTFFDQGVLKVDNWKIKNHGFNPATNKSELLTLQTLFERSSNTFASHIGLKMGPKTFYDYISKFGIGSKTGIELNGEGSGILRSSKGWHNSDTATTGMGHGAISVTPLQLITAVNTVVNRGVFVKPTLIYGHKEIKDTARPVIKAEVADHVIHLLSNSIANNIATKGSVAGKVTGFKVGGKTGTAEKLRAGGGYSKRETIASFVGFFPAENPKLICLVVIDNPKTDGGWGDTVAGPVFNKVSEYTKSLYF